MPFAAPDLHRKEVEAVVLDDTGSVLHRQRFPATREALENFARRHLTKQHRVAFEATTSTWAVADILRPFCAEVVISNPLRTRAIASAKIKTDHRHVRRCLSRRAGRIGIEARVVYPVVSVEWIVVREPVALALKSVSMLPDVDVVRGARGAGLLDHAPSVSVAGVRRGRPAGPDPTNRDRGAVTMGTG
jgi:hypothetical protein